MESQGFAALLSGGQENVSKRSIPLLEVSVLARWALDTQEDFLWNAIGPAPDYRLVPHHSLKKQLAEESGCQGAGGEFWGDLGETGL